MHRALSPLCVLLATSLATSLTVPVPSAAQQPVARAKRTLTLEDYYRVERVGSPRISPDGRWVAYTVSRPIEATNRDSTASWLVRSDASAPAVRVRHEGGDVSNPRWSDDGRLRYSVGNATWTIDPRSPATAPVREQSAQREGVRSPDGRLLARAQDVPREPRPAPAMSDFERRHEQRFEGDAFDWYPFRQDGQRFPARNPRERPAREIFIEPADGSAPARQLTRLGVQAVGGNVQWTPDGRALVFMVNEDAGETTYGTNQLYRVSLDGDLTRVTRDGFNYSGISFSPDGRWMTWERSLGLDTIIGARMSDGGSQDIFVQPVAGGEAVNVTAAFDLDPDGARWSPDGRFLYFTADIGGATHLFRVAVPNGRVEQITTGARRLNGVDFDRAFRRMTYTVGDFDRPSDVYVADIDGRNERRLSDVHVGFLAEVELATRPSESVKWKSLDGTEIEGFLLFPPGYDPQRQRYPLIVMNHGGPHSASGYGFNFKNSLFAAHGYVVLLPNFRSSTGYGDAFKWGTWGGWGIKDGEDVISGIDHLVANYGIDRDRVGTTGHSYGGILTNWLITKYPDRFRAAVPGAGESNWLSNFALSDISRTKETEFFGRPWEPRAREIMIAQSPYLNSGGVKAATLFIHGEVDYRVPLEGAIQLYTCLKKQQVPTKMIIYEGQSHGISGHWNNVHRMMNELRWWETYLKPVTSVSLLPAR